MKRHYSYLLSDHRSGGLKHCSLDRNIKQSFQAGTVGSQLQLIVLKTRNTTWTSLFWAILLLYLINLKWNMKWNKTMHMNWVPTLMEAAHVSAFFCTSSTFSFFPLISEWSACAVSKKKCKWWIYFQFKIKSFQFKHCYWLQYVNVHKERRAFCWLRWSIRVWISLILTIWRVSWRFLALSIHCSRRVLLCW